MTLEEKVARIVDRLWERTKAGEITWETSFDGNLSCNFPDSAVEIYRTETPDQGELIGVVLYDDNGRELTTLPADSIGRREELRALHDLAQREAVGVNRMVDNLLDRLERAS